MSKANVETSQVESVVMLSGIEAIDDCVNIQCSDGNWNYDPYMQGMANGLLLAQSFFKAGELEFKKAPEKWLCDMPDLEKPVISSEA